MTQCQLYCLLPNMVFQDFFDRFLFFETIPFLNGGYVNFVHLLPKVLIELRVHKHSYLLSPSCIEVGQQRNNVIPTCYLYTDIKNAFLSLYRSNNASFWSPNTNNINTNTTLVLNGFCRGMPARMFIKIQIRALLLNL